jgi:glycerate kinase
MKIIIAPNSFKGSLDAFKVAKSIERGLKKSTLDVKCELFPIADGGDHTLEVFSNWLGGAIHKTEVSDPIGKKIVTEWLMLDSGTTAVIEMAKASGIILIPEEKLNPLKASSFGTGQLIKSAIEKGAKKIILGLGGSATVDGGLGILQGLGAELFDSTGSLLSVTGNPLLKTVDISLDKISQQVRDTEFLILCDVENPLLGQNGATYVFGPQKGASPEDLISLESAMKQFNNLIIKKTGLDLSSMEGVGAAGGIAVALKTFFNAQMESGVDFLLSNMGFEEKIKNAELLITAEGRVDAQTLQGKGPYGVASKARQYGVPTIILAGKAEDIDQLNSGFSAVFSITNGPTTLEHAMKKTARDLEITSTQIGNLLALSKL